MDERLLNVAGRETLENIDGASDPKFLGVVDTVGPLLAGTEMGVDVAPKMEAALLDTEEADVEKTEFELGVEDPKVGIEDDEADEEGNIEVEDEGCEEKGLSTAVDDGRLKMGGLTSVDREVESDI